MQVGSMVLETRRTLQHDTAANALIDNIVNKSTSQDWDTNILHNKEAQHLSKNASQQYQNLAALNWSRRQLPN